MEAWALLRQHCNKLNMEELMRFLFETCQQLGLMKELLKLPLGPAEQVGFKKGILRKRIRIVVIPFKTCRP